MIQTNEVCEEYGISEQQLNFIKEYIANGFNGKAAYQSIYPTCSDNSAMTTASKWFRNTKVHRAYKTEFRAHLDIVGVRGLDVVRELKMVAFADLTDYVNFDTNNVTLKGTDEISPYSSAIKEIKIEPAQTKDENQTGGAQTVQSKVTLKLHDKIRALELMGKNLGLFDGDKGNNEPLQIEIIDRTIKKKEDCK